MSYSGKEQAESRQAELCPSPIQPNQEPRCAGHSGKQNGNINDNTQEDINALTIRPAIVTSRLDWDWMSRALRSALF